MSKQGLFITFEGGEGSGKTTQLNRLASYLTEHGHRVATTREPGGTSQADAIRSLIVQKEAGVFPPLAETYLVNAARMVHIRDVIQPALDDGKIVLCDRFSDSTLAYQGYGHGLDLDVVRAINDQACDGLVPHSTLFFDIDPQAGIARTQKRNVHSDSEHGSLEDKFESLDLSFHERLREGFKSLAAAEQDRFHVIDAGQDMDSVFDDILASIRDLIRAE